MNYVMIGEYFIVSTENDCDNGNSKLKLVEDKSAFQRGVVMAAPDWTDIDEDEEIIFVRSEGKPLGQGFPSYVVVVPGEAVIAVVGEKEIESEVN